MILEEDKRLHVLGRNFNMISNFDVPGPVLHAIETIDGWIWTGWRHDGSEKGIKPTKEIGILIHLNDRINILSNDGKWHLF